MGQVQYGHGCDSDNQLNRNSQIRKVIMIPDDYILTSMRNMRTIKVTIKIILDENLDENFNMYQTNTDL